MTIARLTYFDMRGRAESIRLFLHATGTRFEDTRVTSDKEWAKLKSSSPFGALPLYELDGVQLCESHAILRHLGRVLTKIPDDERSATRVDIAQEVFSEAQEDLWRFAWRENYYDHLKSYAEETLRPRLRRISDWGTRDPSQPWFGEDFSYVDCIAFVYFDELDAFFPAVLSDFAELSDHHRRVAALAGISEYVGSGTRPIVFGMGCMGPKVDPRIALAPGICFENPWTPPLDLAAFLANQRRLD